MTAIRTDWTREEISEIYNRPILSLIYQGASVHREFHDPQEVQVCTLLSVKTGGCPEDCAYCPQAARYHTDVKVHKLLEVEEVLSHAIEARENGSTLSDTAVTVTAMADLTNPGTCARRSPGRRRG